MKSKILVMLSMFLIIPCAFLLSACNFGNPMDNANSNIIEVENGKYALQGDKAIFKGLAKKAVATFDMEAQVQDSEGKNYDVTEISDYAFQKCSNLTSIVLPESIKKIGDCIFSECVSLKSVIIPDSVKNLGRKMFINCGSLENVVLPDGITEIKEGMFINCFNLENIIIPSNVTEIQESVFQNCTSITKITLPKNLQILKARAFNNCQNLAEINLPNSLKTVGTSVFKNCDDLLSLEIPESLENVDNDFLYDTKLTKLFINSQNAMTQNIYKQNSTINEVYVGGKVASIPENFFEHSKKLHKLIIDSSVKTLSNKCFFGCPVRNLIINSENALNSTKLDNLPIENLIIGGAIKNIINNAFNENSALKTLEIIDGVEEIGEKAFGNCINLNLITFPNSIKNIGENAFSQTLWFKNQPEGLIYIGNIAYKFKGEMPAETSITLKDGTTSICSVAFKDCGNLIKINIPKNIVFVDASAFLNCSGLKTVFVDSLAFLQTEKLNENHIFDNLDTLYINNTLVFENNYIAENYTLQEADLKYPNFKKYTKNIQEINN